MKFLELSSIIFFVIAICGSSSRRDKLRNGQVVKGSKNAIYLIERNTKRFFPDFNTFVKMGYNLTVIQKVNDKLLEELPLGDPIKPIPVFRPDDYMYHLVCDDPVRLVC
jgi:hypothetical protein